MDMIEFDDFETMDSIITEPAERIRVLDCHGDIKIGAVEKHPNLDGYIIVREPFNIFYTRNPKGVAMTAMMPSVPIDWVETNCIILPIGSFILHKPRKNVEDYYLYLRATNRYNQEKARYDAAYGTGNKNDAKKVSSETGEFPKEEEKVINVDFKSKKRIKTPTGNNSSSVVESNTNTTVISPTDSDDTPPPSVA